MPITNRFAGIIDNANCIYVTSARSMTINQQMVRFET